jgi:hypothetical protein
MGGRRALVVGSQCRSYNLLSFLPAAAQEMAAALLDPEVGGCEPALPDRALLIDPTAVELDDAVSEAFALASQDEATLFLALVGHGDFVGDDFYVLASDTEHPPTSRGSFLLAQRIKELLAQHSLVDGLVLLLDTCHAGMAATQAAQRWVQIVGQAGRRFEVLTASDDRTAADGCFTRTLAKALRDGSTQFGRYVRCADLKPVLTATCRRQTAQYLAFDGQRAVTAGDQGLWLGRNPAGPWHDWPFAGTTVADDIERLARSWRPDDRLSEVVAAVLGGARAVAIVGDNWLKLITSLAALAHPTVATEYVPQRFLHGLILTTEISTPGELAEQLAGQLARTVPGFADAAHSIEPDAAMDEFEFHVTGPLRAVGVRRIRIGMDLWSAPPDVKSAVDRAAFPDGVQLITTDNMLLARWLGTTVMLADFALSQELSGTGGYGSFDLGRHGGHGPTEVAILKVLRQVPKGMKLPLTLLVSSSRRISGPDRESLVRDLLVRLGREVIRDGAGTDTERVASAAASFPDGDPDINSVLADAIAEIAPMAEHDRGRPEHAYAERAEALHLWHARRYYEIISSLDARPSPVPVENRNRWAYWHGKATTPQLRLVTAARQATWTAKAGDPTTALARFAELREEFERELGPTDPETLSLRHNLAYWSAETGRPGWAIEEFDRLAATFTKPEDVLEARLLAAWAMAKNEDVEPAYERLTTLLPECERALGDDHPTTIKVVDNLLFWGEELGHPPPGSFGTHPATSGRRAGDER